TIMPALGGPSSTRSHSCCVKSAFPVIACSFARLDEVIEGDDRLDGRRTPRREVALAQHELFRGGHLAAPTVTPRDRPPGLPLGEYQQRLGANPVVLHRIGSRLGLHHSLEGSHVGDVDDQARFEPSRSRKVRTVIPRDPKTSSRFGELSQWSTSSTSWK